MSSNRKLYISDLHYGHQNCIRFDNRPFKTVEEMNEELVKRWNNSVDKSDVVYVLGDMFWCKGKEAVPILRQLNGTKILVKGNHDRCNDKEFSEEFAKIDEYIEVQDGNKNIVLCHYPIPCFKNHFYGWYHLYGHVHTTFEWNMMENDRKIMEATHDCKCNMYNVGAMLPYMDYTPRTVDEIIDGYNKLGEF